MEIFLTRHGGLVCDPSDLEAESGEIIARSRLLGLHGKFQARHTHRVRPVSNTHAHVGEWFSGTRSLRDELRGKAKTKMLD